MISTKAAFRTGPGPDGIGASRKHLVEACEASLRRLGTDRIDLWQLHAFDALTPIEETLHAMDDLVRAGKVRYIGCSNFSGWHLMKSLAFAERHGLSRYVAHQAYYSLLGREYEWELMPLGLDQGVGAVVWSPLGWGRLTGKLRRGQPLPADARVRHDKTMAGGPRSAVLCRRLTSGSGCPRRMRPVRRPQPSGLQTTAPTPWFSPRGISSHS